MGPHSVGPQVCGKVRASFSCVGVNSAAAARSPKASASPAPLYGGLTLSANILQDAARWPPLYGPPGLWKGQGLLEAA